MPWWAARWSCLCTREETGEDRAGVTAAWGPGLMPWRPSGSRRCRERMVSLPWTWGGCSTCMPCQGSFRAPRLPYKSWGKGVPQLLKTQTPNILETASREIGRLPLFCCIFFGWLSFGWVSVLFSLSSSLHTSLFPHNQVSACPGNPSSMHGARTSVPEGDPAMGRREPGAVTASWPKGGQNEVTLQPQPGAFVQVHYNLGLKSHVITSIRLTV